MLECEWSSHARLGGATARPSRGARRRGHAALVSARRPSHRLETLTSAGFEVAVEQVSMSFGGHALPGKRDLYLALMHPTLG